MKKVLVNEVLGNYGQYGTFNDNEKTVAKKVYVEKRFWFPSGLRLMYLVWCEKQNRCLWVKADYCTVINNA